MIAGDLHRLIPQAHYLKTTGRMEPWDWLRYAKIMVRGAPYRTEDGHEYLEQIIKDNHPDQTIEKAAQVAASTWMLLKGIYVAEHLGMKVVYFLQDDSAIGDFSNDRCLSILQESPYLRTRVGNIKNVGLREVGPGKIYFRGIWSRGKAKTVDADFIVLDELAEMSSENMQLARDRIMHSKLQWIHFLSQPNLPGTDIDAEFQATDQHYWHLVCPSCGYKDNVLEIDFPENFKPIPASMKSQFRQGAKYYRACKKCDAKLDVAKGIWVPNQPTKHRRGYHISQLYTRIIPPGFANYASAVMNEYFESRKSQAKMSRFTISILGFPYGGGAARVTDDLLNQCEGMHGWAYSGNGYYMGVDQGDRLHVAIGPRNGAGLFFEYFEETEDWNRLDALMEQFNVDYCVVDAEPNKYNAKQFAQKHKGRVSIQYFAGKALKKGTEPAIGGAEGEEVDVVSQDRTESLDLFIDAMEQGQIYFPSRADCSDATLAKVEEVRAHLKRLTCKFVTNAKGNTVRVYAKGPHIVNHYGMACNSARIAAFEFGNVATTTVMPIFVKMGRA